MHGVSSIGLNFTDRAAGIGAVDDGVAHALIGRIGKHGLGVDRAAELQGREKYRQDEQK